MQIARRARFSPAVKMKGGQTCCLSQIMEIGFASCGSDLMKSGSVGASPVNPWLNQQLYCLSETTTLSTSCPSASLPLMVEVRVFPSLETFEVTVIITWPPCFIVDTIVSAPTRFTETMSA